MWAVVEGNDSRVICHIRNRQIQDDEIACHEGRKLLREQLQLINSEEPNPLVVDNADVDSANPEQDDDGDENDDVEINIQRFTMYVISCCDIILRERELSFR